MTRQIVLDTETTGLSAENGDRIIEIGCVELLNRKLSGNNKHFYLNPGRDSHEDALKVHGISNEFLRDKPPFAAIASDLLDYLTGAEIIIHNAAFDVGFLDKELELIDKPKLRECTGCHVTDTLALAKDLYPGKRNSLDALCDRLGVDNSSRTLHGALLDAELLADVYINLTRGQDPLLIELEAEDPAAAGGRTTVQIDFSGLPLVVLAASAEEARAHDAILGQLDKACGGQAVWRRAEAPAPLA